MPRRPQLKIRTTPEGYRINIPPTLSASGKRERRYFQRKDDALKAQAALRRQLHERGIESHLLSPRLAEEAIAAKALLAPFGASVLDAAREYVERRKASGSLLELERAWEGYEARLKKLGRSKATLSDYARDKRRMPSWLLEMEVAAIEGEHIEKALDEIFSSRGATWNRFLRQLRAVINWSRNTEAKEENLRREEPEILEPDHAKRLMRAAEKEGVGLAFALQLFAGIRPQGELRRIHRANLGEDFITLARIQTKTSTDRQIPIMPNLRAWIDAHGPGVILPSGWERKRRAVRRAVQIDGQDVLRHTFGSAFYRLRGEAEIIEAMGHTSVKTFLRYYKAAMTPADAAKLFEIFPLSGARG